ncbi:MAG: DUF1559 domain-containing protein [Phycisphaeraceae bacterium]|nr:DUF1559 domain-containing protein [Phycisphaeraceae bacterium]MBX3405323.1 DUF1559 domain-containing protein [Phycisphaeraceae bacterium]
MGFTLIELLIVIVIISILVGLILPAVAKARETARTTICTSNVRQVVLAFTTYAADYRVIPGTYWQGPQNMDWCGRNNVVYTSNPSAYTHPLRTSVLYDYLSQADRILECPSARRASNNLFDYTMVIRFAGARIDLPWRVNYPERPEVANGPRKEFATIPLIVEEHDEFYNRTYDDGSFAGTDQFSTRHGVRKSGSDAGGRRGAGNIGYLDGSVGLFRPPVGGNDRAVEPADLDASKIRIIKKPGTSFTINDSSAAEFGWINRSQ